METLRENWFWIVVLVLFALMHMGHGGHGGHRRRDEPAGKEPGSDGDRVDPESESGGRHAKH